MAAGISNATGADRSSTACPVKEGIPVVISDGRIHAIGLNEQPAFLAVDSMILALGSLVKPFSALVETILPKGE